MAEPQCPQETPPSPTSKQILLSQAGAFEDDQEDLAELRAAIYK